MNIKFGYLVFASFSWQVSVVLGGKARHYLINYFTVMVYLSIYLFIGQGLKDSGIGSQGITNSINMMTKVKSTVINLPAPSYTMG